MYCYTDEVYTFSVEPVPYHCTLPGVNLACVLSTNHRRASIFQPITEELQFSSFTLFGLLQGNLWFSCVALWGNFCVWPIPIIPRTGGSENRVMAPFLGGFSVGLMRKNFKLNISEQEFSWKELFPMKTRLGCWRNGSSFKKAPVKNIVPVKIYLTNKNLESGGNDFFYPQTI